MSPRHDPPAHRKPHEPLTPEERAWAQRLAQVGPHAGPQGGPPPALDARILAAAHAAAVRHPQRRSVRRRWPALFGAAASLVIVVGLAWQLQPLLRSRPSVSEGPTAAVALPASDGTLSAEVLAAADPVARRAVDPPPGPAVAAVTPSPRKRSIPPPMNGQPLPATAPPLPPARPAIFGDDAIPPYSDYAGMAASKRAGSSGAASNATAGAQAPSQREAAAAVSSPAPFPAGPADAAPAADMSAAPGAAPSLAEQRRIPAPRGVQPRSPAPAPPATVHSVEVEHAANAVPASPRLDRIEVTGSRVAMADLPVRDDAALEPAAWLQRIRDRRDGGDLDGARRSLALFRDRHPRLRLPDDLARLGR